MVKKANTFLHGSKGKSKMPSKQHKGSRTSTNTIFGHEVLQTPQKSCQKGPKTNKNTRSIINHSKSIRLDHLQSLRRPQEGRKSLKFASLDTKQQPTLQSLSKAPNTTKEGKTCQVFGGEGFLELQTEQQGKPQKLVSLYRT